MPAMGISTASFFSRLDNENAVAYIGQSGFSCCEVFLETYREYEEAFAYIIKQKAEENQTQVVSVHAMSQQFEPQLFSTSQRQKEDAFQIYRNVLRAGQIMGATHYVLHGPALVMGNKVNEHFAQRWGHDAVELAQCAQDYGLQLCWENVSWCAFNVPDFADWILENGSHDNLRFTFDIKQAIRSGVDPFLYLEKMRNRLGNVHLCDYQLDEAGHIKNLALPGKGQFDFERLGRCLQAMHYEGYCMTEVYSSLYEDKNELLESARLTAKRMGLRISFPNGQE